MIINQSEFKARLPKLVKDYSPFFSGSGLSDDNIAQIIRVKAETTPRGKFSAKKTSNGEAELLIYEEIGLNWWTGQGMTPKKLADELDAMKPFDKLVVRINSPGGDVFDGVAIFNILLRQEAKMRVEIEGIAGSAASFIAQVADKGELCISEAGMAMVHFAMGGLMVFANKKIIRKEADMMCEILDKIDNQIAGIYANRSGRKVGEWLAMMEEETWLTGEEAVAAKFADVVLSTVRASDPEDEDEEDDEDEDIYDRNRQMKLAAAARVRVLELDQEAVC